jgi:CRISPR-associated protein Csm2
MSNYHKPGPKSGYPSRRKNIDSYAPEVNLDWIRTKINRDGIEFAQKFGSALAANGRGMTTSQIRNFFGEVKRIQMNGFGKESSQTAFLLLQPKLAYAAKRAGNDYVDEFRKVMDKVHVAVNSENEFQNFVNFLEAILAYHKAAGGRE